MLTVLIIVVVIANVAVNFLIPIVSAWLKARRVNHQKHKHKGLRSINVYWNWFRRWLKPNWAIAILILLSMSLPAIQYGLSEKQRDDEKLLTDSLTQLQKLEDRRLADAKEARKDSAYRDDKRKSDSIHNAESQSIIEALAQYNFKYDSSQKIVINYLTDSIKFLQQPYPALDVCLGKGIKATNVNKDTTVVFLSVSLCSQMAPVYDIRISFRTVIMTMNDSLYLTKGEIPLMYESSSILKDGTSTVSDIRVRSFSGKIKSIYLILTGSFANSPVKRNQKTLPLNAIRSIDIKEGGSGAPNHTTKRRIDKILKDHSAKP